MAGLVLQAFAVIGSLVTAAGILFLWKQTRQMQKQTQDDHERSRREELITVMRNWNQDISPNSAAAQKLGASLSTKQCKALNRMEPIEIDEEHLPLLKAALTGIATDLRVENGSVLVGVQEVTHLRYLIVRYLNTLEICLAAWHLGIVDLPHMESEFSFLSDCSVTDPALSKFRSVLGTEDKYPALTAFLKTITEKRSVQPERPLNTK